MMRGLKFVNICFFIGFTEASEQIGTPFPPVNPKLYYPKAKPI